MLHQNISVVKILHFIQNLFFLNTHLIHLQLYNHYSNNQLPL